MRRPRKARFWTAHDVATWIHQNVTNEHAKEPYNAAIWFVAYQEAEPFFDWRRKDFASLLADGLKPYTQREVSAYVQRGYRDIADDPSLSEKERGEAMRGWVSERDADLEQELREFFGVKEGV